MKQIRPPTAKEKAFIELYNSGFGYLVDCYIEAYSSKGSRRTSMCHASQVKARPAVYMYLGWLREVQTRINLNTSWEHERAYPSTISYSDFLIENGFRLKT